MARHRTGSPQRHPRVVAARRRAPQTLGPTFSTRVTTTPDASPQHHMADSPRRLIPMVRRITLTTALVTSGLWAGVAAGASGRLVKSPDNPPTGGAALRGEGVFCRADSKNFRVWWSDSTVPGAGGALVGSDGNCATLPPVAQGVLDVAEATRATATSRGFPSLVGDAAPAFPLNRAAFNTLRRLPAASRARTLSSIPVATRGRLLAGFTPAQRTTILRGLPGSLRARLSREIATTLAGRPKDFVGGDRRLDIILDRTGVTGLVGGSLKGVAPCRTSISGTTRRFLSASAVVLTPDAEVPRSTLAHELFHSVQCVMRARGDLLMHEGTAEWFAALTEPGAFAGLVISDGSGTTVTGGATRAISFCRDFDPSRTGTLDVYNSWPVWTALDLASPGAVRAAILKAAQTPRAVMESVGDGQWSASLLSAVTEVCGNLRSPAGQPIFAPQIRDFFSDGRPVASPGLPATAIVWAGGVQSLVATWTTAPTQVVLRVSAPGIAPATLATRLVVQTGGVVVPVTSDPTASLITLVGPQAAAGAALVTVASPAIAGAISVTLEVTTT